MALFALQGACGDGNPARIGPQFDTLPSGAIQVQNPGIGAWDFGEGWVLRETLRLGTVFGEGPDLFGRVMDLEIDAMGRLWVFDAQAEELRLFAPDGEHLRTVGRAGEGPGEFGNVYALALNPANQLWVVDRGLGRVSIFDTAGVFLEGRRRGNPFFALPWPGGIDRQGFFYDLESKPGPERSRFLVRYDSLLRAVDTIPLPQHPDGPAEIHVRTEGGVSTYSKPFAGTAEWVLTRDGGMWVAITDQYRLLRISRTGDTLRVITKPFDPVSVTREERDQVLDGYGRSGVDLSAFEIPDSKPAIATLFVDDKDRPWVIPVKPGDRTGSVAEVFDSDGVYLGEVQLPVPLFLRNPVVFRDGMLATVTTDSLGVPFVVQFRIQAGGEH